jgi:hypothetical protein
MITFQHGRIIGDLDHYRVQRNLVVKRRGGAVLAVPAGHSMALPPMSSTTDEMMPPCGK